MGPNSPGVSASNLRSQSEETVSLTPAPACRAHLETSAPNFLHGETSPVETSQSLTTNIVKQAPPIGCSARESRHAWIDPYGQYHQPRKRSDRFPYGTRPLSSEPHIVLEYRELIPTLDKAAVHRLANGFYLPKKTETAETETTYTQLDEVGRNDLEDAAAVAAAAASATASALDAANKSSLIVDRLKEEDFNAKVAAKCKAQWCDEDILDGIRYSVDPICLDPLNDDESDNDSMTSVELNMANTRLAYKVHRHRCQIPRDYIDLQRHFVAQHPRQYRPLSIERDDGTIIFPSEKRFEHGETIVFREFTLAPIETTSPELRSIMPTHCDHSVQSFPKETGDCKHLPFDWERAYAIWARQDMNLEGA